MRNDEVASIYRPSATLLIAVKSSTTEQGYNYRLLLAKRAATIAFAPDHYVFPGGVFDSEADENIEWLQHFKNFGIYREDLDKLCLQHLPNRPNPIMTSGVVFSRDIALRITAIRETFEEVGILLCVNRSDLKNTNNPQRSLMLSFDRQHWQHKVHNNPAEFLNLCKQLDVVPDLWSLYEWSVWRSPPMSAKKYDTVLYAVTLEKQPKLLLESSEVENVLWATPRLSLEHFKNCSLWLSPLNFYEISRACNICEWQELQRFIKKRNPKGSTLLMLAYFQCLDHLVGVLPGDDFYPDRPLSHLEPIKLSITDMEFKAKTKKLHRITYYDMYNLKVTSNIKPIDSHLSPSPHLLDSKSKL